jgi:hypothetical protein
MPGIEHQQSQMFSYLWPETGCGRIILCAIRAMECSTSCRDGSTPRTGKSKFVRLSLHPVTTEPHKVRQQAYSGCAANDALRRLPFSPGQVYRE